METKQPTCIECGETERRVLTESRGKGIWGCWDCDNKAMQMEEDRAIQEGNHGSCFFKMRYFTKKRKQRMKKDSMDEILWIMHNLDISMEELEEYYKNNPQLNLITLRMMKRHG